MHDMETVESGELLSRLGTQLIEPKNLSSVVAFLVSKKEV